MIRRTVFVDTIRACVLDSMSGCDRVLFFSIESIRITSRTRSDFNCVERRLNGTLFSVHTYTHHRTTELNVSRTELRHGQVRR